MNAEQQADAIARIGRTPHQHKLISLKWLSRTKRVTGLKFILVAMYLDKAGLPLQRKYMIEPVELELAGSPFAITLKPSNLYRQDLWWLWDPSQPAPGECEVNHPISGQIGLCPDCPPLHARVAKLEVELAQVQAINRGLIRSQNRKIMASQGGAA